MYPNLRAEMARQKVTNEMLANAIGRNQATTSNKLNSENRLKLYECFIIRKTFFPDKTVDYLFNPDNNQIKENQWNI